MTTDPCVNVNVFLNEEAVATLSDLCAVLAVWRKDLVAAMARNYNYICLEDITLTELGAVKVQSEVPETFVKEATTCLKSDKSTVISSVFNQLLTQELIDGRLFRFDAPVLDESLGEALRWFRFGAATGMAIEEACNVSDTRLLRLEKRIGSALTHTCYGTFRHEQLTPHNFGFRGTISEGELHLNVVLPL